MKRVWYFPISSSAPWTTHVSILLSEVEQEHRRNSNGDREAIVVGADLCDGEGERAYTVYDPTLGGKNTINIVRRLRKVIFCSWIKLFENWRFCKINGRKNKMVEKFLI